jgi:hypothetical protein
MGLDGSTMQEIRSGKRAVAVRKSPTDEMVNSIPIHTHRATKASWMDTRSGGLWLAQLGREFLGSIRTRPEGTGQV